MVWALSAFWSDALLTPWSEFCMNKLCGGTQRRKCLKECFMRTVLSFWSCKQRRILCYFRVVVGTLLAGGWGGAVFGGVQEDYFSKGLLGTRKSRKLFLDKAFKNLSGHERPCPKSWTSAPKSVFSCDPNDGEKLFWPWPSGRKGQECRRIFRPKRLCLCWLFPKAFRYL